MCEAGDFPLILLVTYVWIDYEWWGTKEGCIITKATVHQVAGCCLRLHKRW
jgi:hypothetical protein